MKKIILGFVLVSLFILSMGCAAQSEFVQYQIPATVYEKRFVLAANGTTGYEWRVVKQSPGLEVSLNYEASTNKKRVGVGGVENVLVRFLPGFQKGTLVLQYVRPWKNGGVAKTKTIDFYR